MKVPPIPFALEHPRFMARPGRILWFAGRWLVPPTYRHLYEGHRQLPALFWFEDSRVLYNTIRTFKPQRCFEIGTWYGGGSTLVIARALRRNGGGELHTVEIEQEIHEHTLQKYDRYLHRVRPHVHFHLGDYEAILSDVIDRVGGVDFFFLDGAEDAQQTLDQFEFFDRRSHAGTVLVAHDWNTDKTRLLRPLLEESEDWEIVETAGPPKSVGLAVAVRRR